MTIITLSTLDHVFANDAVAPIQAVLHYPAELQIARLEASFAATAQEFVGVDGVLTRIDECTLGLDLSRAAAEVSIAALGPEVPLAECISPISTELGKPVARLHVAQLGRRGTALSFSLSHAVADGYGYFLFLSAFAARYRGETFFTPKCDRDALATEPADMLVSTAAGQLTHSGFMLVDDQPRQFMRVEERHVALSKLKERPRGDPRGSYTSSDFLAAMLWQETIAGEPFAETTFTCAVDLRKHCPTTGPLFFGNASFLASKTVSMEALQNTPTEEVALWVRAAIDEAPKRVDAGLAELEALRRRAGLGVFSRLRSVRPDGGFVFSNLSKIPLSPLDFGSGPPSALVRPARPRPHERSCAVLAAADASLLLLISRP